MGYLAAGYEPIGAVELDPAICEVYRANIGPHIRCESVTQTDWRTFDRPDLLHMSPVCKNASRAKVQRGPQIAGLARGETPGDVAMAEGIIRALESLTPPTFVLENVVGYRLFTSFKRIVATLDRLGYMTDVQHLNSADFGVPQTRVRLILRAVRGGLVPMLPPPVPWVGWYAAIEDLLPSLPESTFAPWQLARLAPLFASTLVHPTETRRDGTDGAIAPAFTVTGTHGVPRAFLVNGGNASNDNDIREGVRPAHTLATPAATAGMRAFLMRSTNAGQEWGKGFHVADEPSMAVSANMERQSRMPVAWLVGTNGEHGDLCRDADSPAQTIAAAHGAEKHRAFLVSAQSQEGGAPTTRHGGEPAVTVGTNGANQRAFIVDDQHGAQAKGEHDRGLTNRQATEPVFTVQAGANKPARAWLEQGRVVAMTPRALGRFQGLPDAYRLPERRVLACTIIGNGVPVGLAEAIGRSLLGCV